MIKAIFWDNDGVLGDTEALYFQATVITSYSIHYTKLYEITLAALIGVGIA